VAELGLSSTLTLPEIMSNGVVWRWQSELPGQGRIPCNSIRAASGKADEEGNSIGVRWNWFPDELQWIPCHQS